MKPVVFLFFIAASVGLREPAIAQADSAGGLPPDGERAAALLKEAKESYVNFKNGPAFGALIEYAALRQKEYEESVAAEHKRIADGYEEQLAGLQARLDTLNGSVTELKAGNSSLAEEKSRLLQNTVLLFLLLAGSLAAALAFLRRKMLYEEKLQSDSGVRLAHSRALSGLVDSSSRLASDTLFSFDSVHDLTPRTQSQVGKLRAMSVTLGKKSDLMVRAEEVLSRMHELAAVGQSALQQFQDFSLPAGDKTATNLNVIIDDTAHLSYLWMKSRYEDFEAAISLDLEKILPEIDTHPGEIRKALFCFFNNAFYSIYRKAGEGQAGFEGRVTVTSRRLPRFVQVRIRDNGTGVDEKLREKVFEPFYTTRPPEHGAGLGLSFGRDIIQARHEGEANFESDTGNGTDLLIRFPLNIR